MARDATARLYDVDDNSFVLKRLTQLGKYDTGTITFRARKDRLIELDKLHESIWATRLSKGTSSGLVSLEVTAAGEVVVGEKETILKVSGSTAHFVLAKNLDDPHKTVFDKLCAALDRGEKVGEVTGRLDGWSGRWPDVLRELPPKPRRILVTDFEMAK